jgi:hypothetical protein
MKENISVEAGKCCTHTLNETFRSVIRQVLFLRGRQVLPHLGKRECCKPNRMTESVPQQAECDYAMPVLST